MMDTVGTFAEAVGKDIFWCRAWQRTPAGVQLSVLRRYGWCIWRGICAVAPSCGAFTHREPEAGREWTRITESDGQSAGNIT